MGCGKERIAGENCVCEVVRFIDDIQDVVSENCITNCLDPVLGNNDNNAPYNTRPFVLYTSAGEPFKALFTRPLLAGEEAVEASCHAHCSSKFFRVESVDGCCAQLRVLRPTRPHIDDCDVFANPQANLRATENCITVDLHCFCAIQCLRDIALAGV